MADPILYEVPCTGAPETFSVTLSGVTYQLTINYHNVDQGGYTVDIADAGGNPINCGVPLVTGEDVLAGQSYLMLGGRLGIYTDGDPLADPVYGDLGGVTHLLWVAP